MCVWMYMYVYIYICICLFSFGQTIVYVCASSKSQRSQILLLQELMDHVEDESDDGMDDGERRVCFLLVFVSSCPIVL